MGLNLCPSNLALELLLDFKGQKKGDNNIFVAMESLWSDEHNRNQIFEIEFATSQPRLSSVVAEPDSIFGPDCQFVFLRNEMR